MASAPPIDRLALWALALGIASIPAGIFLAPLGVLLGGPALGLGLVAQHRIASASGRLGGGGVAEAAWICGASGLVLGLFFLALLLLIAGAWIVGG